MPAWFYVMTALLFHDMLLHVHSLFLLCMYFIKYMLCQKWRNKQATIVSPCIVGSEYTREKLINRFYYVFDILSSIITWWWFEICAWAMRHVIRTRGNSRLNKGRIVINQVKTHRPAEARIYHSYLELVISRKAQWASDIQLLNTLHDQRCCRQTDNASLTQSNFTRSVSQKSGTRIFATGGGGDCDTCHQDNLVIWQRRLHLLSIETLNCFYEADC